MGRPVLLIPFEPATQLKLWNSKLFLNTACLNKIIEIYASPRYWFDGPDEEKLRIFDDYAMETFYGLWVCVEEFRAEIEEHALYNEGTRWNLKNWIDGVAKSSFLGLGDS